MTTRKSNPEHNKGPRPPVQSRGIAASLLPSLPALSVLSPAWSTDYPQLVFKRGKNERLYDLDGNVYLDFDLAGGRLLFGHAPPFLTQPIKNSISLGALDNTPTLSLTRLYAHLKTIIPSLLEYELYFLPDIRAARGMLLAAYPGWEPLIPEILTPEQMEARTHSLRGNGGPILLDEGDSFYRTSPETAINILDPDGVVIDGILNLPLLLLKPGHPLHPRPWIPDQQRLTTALEMLRAVRGPRSPYSHLASLVACFERHCRHTVSGKRGFSPKIELSQEERSALLRQGFYLGASGYIHFCASHSEKAVSRLGKAINALKEQDPK